MSRPRLVLSPPSPPSSLSTPEAPTRHRVVKRYYVGPLPTYALGFYKSPSHSRTSSHRAWYYFLTSSSTSPSGYSSVRTYQPTSQSNYNNHFNSSNSNGNANSTQCFRRRFGTKLGFMTSSSRSNNQSNNRHRSQNEAANVTAMTTSSIGNDHVAQLSNENISNALRESSTTSSSGSSSSTNDDQSNVQTPLLIGRKHHTTAPSTPSHRIRDPIAPHTPVDSIKRIDSSIHPLPKLSTPIMRQQRPSAVSTSVSAPPTVPGTTAMTSPNTNEMSQHNIKVESPIATITDIIASDITPTAESLCHLMLLRVERVHPHNMPDVYHQGVAIFTSLRSVQWRQVVGQLDGAHLSFHQPSSPSSSVPGKVLYSLELAHYQQLKLSFFSPLDNSLALGLVSQYKEDMVEVFIFQLKEDHLLQQWYSRLEKLIEQRLSWQDQLLAGRDPCQLLQRPTLAVANAAMSNRLSISSGGRTSYRQHSPRERTTKRRSKRHSKLRGRHSMEKEKREHLNYLIRRKHPRQIPLVTLIHHFNDH
ncbi:hypothetical protein BDF22DRAFT_450427 [Syncephalis plumigaleata]|nr:hypothetical protein BDF22DRAFT_450427 [Syncephalis plumigaleata]